MHAAPPNILYIYREFWKSGAQAELDRIEAKAARTCIDLGCPHPFLGIESLTGPKEVWYLNGFVSSGNQERVRDEYAKKDLFSTMNQFTTERAPFQSQPGKDYSTNYRTELSRGSQWTMGKGRFLLIEIAHGGSGGNGSVFTSQDGLHFFFSATDSREDANRRLATAGSGSRLFAVRPDFSLPDTDWVAADPELWANFAVR